MLRNPERPDLSGQASSWVARFLRLVKPAGLVLDVAAGAGRHVRLLCERGFAVRAVDRNVAALRVFAGPRCEVVETDLETGAPWPLGDGYDGIVVTNYLCRPLPPAIARALAPGGVVIYETFAQGNERFGRPDNPDFLLRPGEVLVAFANLTTVAFEQGKVESPRPAVIQRIAAVAGPLARLPSECGLERASADTGLDITQRQADARPVRASQTAGRGPPREPCLGTRRCAPGRPER
jgi:SAM-dependent methyltransferase